MNDLTDTISVHINTSVAKEIGLEAVFIGEIYTKTYGSNKIFKPDCGDLEVENTGVMIQKELGYTNVKCNDSFRDYLQNPEKRYRFICDSNGEWVGEWPVCQPIVTCPENEIIRYRDPTAEIEEISNAYFMSSNQWFAINETRVRYTCQRDNDIMVGKSYRVCEKNGKWSNKSPYCTGTSFSGFTISGILFAVLITFVLIVFLVFRFHSKRVELELIQTRNEIEETARKRFSEEFYADVRETNLYENKSRSHRKSLTYDSVGYETTCETIYDPFYRGQNTSSEYLDLLGVKKVMKL